MGYCFLSQAVRAEGGSHRIPLLGASSPARHPPHRTGGLCPRRGQEGAAPTYLDQAVAQQPQVPVPHGPRAHQDVGVLAVVPLVVD